MNRRLIETAERIAADVVLLGHAEFVTAETLIQLKKTLAELQNRHVVGRLRHNLAKYDAVMKQRMPLLDALFMTSEPDFVRSQYAPTREVKVFLHAE